MLSTIVYLASVLFTWQPAPSGPAVDGYRIYFGTQPGTYGQSLDVGNVTQREMDVDVSLVKYFTVRAYNQFGESPNSNEVTVGKPLAPTQFQISE